MLHLCAMTNTNTPKFRKEFAGRYVAEFNYNGTPAKVVIEKAGSGWSWSSYLQGEGYQNGDGGNSFQLKDFKNNSADYFMKVW